MSLHSALRLSSLRSLVLKSARSLRAALHHPLRRLLAGVVLVAYVAGCTSLPSGQKAFDSFEQCIAGNLGLATAGGIAFGALGKALARQVTGDSGVQNRVAAAAGVAGAVMIGLTAWRKCAAVYSKSEPVVQAVSYAAPPPAPAQRRRPGFQFDRLDVRVEGTDNDPPTPEFEFIYTADDVAARDIKAQFRHKVEIVRFKSDDNDQLILADASGATMLEGGRPIPLANAIRMPRDRLAWISIAEEGRDDYTEDVVIQPSRPSTFRHRLQVPPRAQLPIPLPVPMRYTVTVEAAGQKAARSVDFALLTTGERPRRFSSNAVPGSADRGPAAPPLAPVATPTSSPVRADERATPASKAFEATHSARRGVPMYDQANLPHKSIARISRGEGVHVEERLEVQTNNRLVQWVKVVTEDGKSGWLPASEVAESK